jgi:HTH-type transcriptional regulator/antitoxin HipB
MLGYHDIMRKPIYNEYELGHALREVRKQRGLTQAQLAAKASVSRAFVIALENGTTPRSEMMRVLRVIRALGLRIALEDDDSPGFDEALAQLIGGGQERQ